MSFESTPTQALLIFGLLARHGECPQAELMPAVKKADREALVAARLVTVEKVGRGLYLRLEDAGWGWAGSHLSAELPPVQRALSDMLARLAEHLMKSGETLADFIGSKPRAAKAEPKLLSKPKATRAKSKSPRDAPVKPKPPGKATSAPAKPTQPQLLTAATLRKRIESAYLFITGNKKNQVVKLSVLRRELHDIDRPTIDAALGRILAGDRKASLMRHDDPRQIDEADREAAFSPFGEPFHVLWIAS